MATLQVFSPLPRVLNRKRNVHCLELPSRSSWAVMEEADNQVVDSGSYPLEVGIWIYPP